MSAQPAKPLRVLIVTPLGRGGMGGIDRIMDAVVDRVTVPPRADLKISVGVTRGRNHIAWSPLLVASVLLRACGRLIGLGPDLVHINMSQRGSVLRKIAIARWARMLRIPYIIHLHGSVFHSYWNGVSPALSAKIRLAFLHSAGTIVLGRAWSEYVRSRVPEIGDRIHILPNATSVPAPYIRTYADHPRILFLGLVGPRKGVPQLVEALSNLKHISGWSAVLAGNGDVEATKAILAERGLGERVSMPGWVGPADVERLLMQSDILVLPSIAENLPMSVIEGMAHGLAIITTPVGATTDIIEDGKTGLLVPPGDSAALTKALERMIGDVDLRRRLGCAAQAFHRAHLDMDVYVERIVGIWHSMA